MRPTRVHEMILSEPHFSNVRSGRKKIEGRKNSETWQPVQVGDFLSILPEQPSTEKPFSVKVTAIRIYSGKDPLFDYLLKEGLERTLPDAETITEAMEVYLKFWKAAEIKKLGMRAFTLKLVKKE